MSTEYSLIAGKGLRGAPSQLDTCRYSFVEECAPSSINCFWGQVAPQLSLGACSPQRYPVGEGPVPELEHPCCKGIWLNPFEHPCPFCGAGAGDVCKTRNPNPYLRKTTRHPHIRRIRAAETHWFEKRQ